MATQDIHVPDLGDFADVVIVDVLVKPGDRVETESGLLTLETDKATMDVPSPLAGVIKKVHVAKGDRVSTGTLVATVEVSGAEAVKADAESAKPTIEKGPKPEADQPDADPRKKPPASQPSAASRADQASSNDSAPAAEQSGSQSGDSRSATAPPPVAIDQAAFVAAHASPSIRALARELGVDLSRVPATGRKGRISAEDVKGFVKSVMSNLSGSSAATGGALPPVPSIDFSKFGPVEVLPLGRISRIAGPRLHASWVNIPHVTQVDEADVTDLEEARRWLKLRASADGIALTSLAFVLRACVLALKELPRFNASLDSSGHNLVMKNYCHLGFAADTPGGLVVPVIRDADRLDVFELARALGDLSLKAREGRLSAAEMQGGCFTVSNLGGIGGTSFTPIINAPEVAVLGVSRAKVQPVWTGEEFRPRTILPLSLSYDHRVIDGADGARFTTLLAKSLADVPALMAAA